MMISRKTASFFFAFFKPSCSPFIWEVGSLAVLQAEEVFLARDGLKIRQEEKEYEPQAGQSHQEPQWAGATRDSPSQNVYEYGYAHVSGAGDF